jgi:tetratricopeptide (TPR) repeat protein
MIVPTASTYAGVESLLRALELDRVNDAYAYFFSAIAYFNLNQLPEAEKRALKAEEIDRAHHEPLIQFLLAQICEAKRDSVETSHLREYLKFAPDAQDSGEVKKNHLPDKSSNGTADVRLSDGNRVSTKRNVFGVP